MLGLVLEGGGAKGSYQIGAVKALYEMGYEFDAITGTSIGAINGAFLTQGKFDEILEIWEHADLSKIINTDTEMFDKLMEFDISTKNFSEIFSYLSETVKAGGLDINPLKRLLEENLDEDKLRKSNVDFGLVTVNLSDFRPLEIFIEEIPKGKLVDYIIASASLPVFALDKLDGKLFLDGGFYDNIPINLVARKGIKDIIVIETEGIGRKRSVEDRNLNITRISPSFKLSKTLEIKPEILRRNINIGYLDTYKVMKNYYGAKYYINTYEKDEYFINKILKLEDKKLIEFKKLFNFKEKVTKRKIFEIIIPILGKLIDADENSSYTDIFIKLDEILGEYHGVDILKIYTQEEFHDLVLSNVDFDENIEISEKYRYLHQKYLIRSIDLLPKKISLKLIRKFYSIFYRELKGE